MNEEIELAMETAGGSTEKHAEYILDAIERANRQQITWLTEGGHRFAAIVPVDVAKHGEALGALVPAAVMAAGVTAGLWRPIAKALGRQLRKAAGDA